MWAQAIWTGVTVGYEIFRAVLAGAEESDIADLRSVAKDARERAERMRKNTSTPNSTNEPR